MCKSTYFQLIVCYAPKIKENFMSLFYVILVVLIVICVYKNMKQHFPIAPSNKLATVLNAHRFPLLINFDHSLYLDLVIYLRCKKKELRTNEQITSVILYIYSS